MTKYIDKTKEKEVKKKTKFVKWITTYSETSNTIKKPEEFDYVELIRRKDNYYEFDLLVAYNEGDKGKVEWWFRGYAGDEFEGVLKNES